MRKDYVCIGLYFLLPYQNTSSIMLPLGIQNTNYQS